MLPFEYEAFLCYICNGRHKFLFEMLIQIAKLIYLRPLCRCYLKSVLIILCGVYVVLHMHDISLYIGRQSLQVSSSL